MTHELKCHDVYFDAIERGEKTFEIRRDDRGFQKGDFVTLVRYVKGAFSAYEIDCDYSTGKPRKTLTFRIGWILTGGQFGLEPGYVAFSLKKIDGLEPAK